MGVAEVSERTCQNCVFETCSMRGVIQGKIQCSDWQPIPTADATNPAHYTTGDIECIDAIRASMSAEAFRGHLKGCCIKYLWRYEDKGGAESLKKCRWYLDRLIGELE